MNTILGTIARLTAIQAGLAMAQQSALRNGAKIIQEEAKARIGTYQGAEGPFAGWAPLEQETQEERVRKGFSPNDPLLRSGGMRDSIEFNASSTEANIGSNEEAAKAQELGTLTIPARSFLGGAAYAKEEEVVDQIASDVIAAHIIGGLLR